MFKRLLNPSVDVSKDKKYHRKYSKKWRLENKKLHNEYQSTGITGTFSAFKKSKKKSKSKLF